MTRGGAERPGRTFQHDAARPAMRMANTNHRTRREDMDALVGAIIDLAPRIEAERDAR
jgi:hypothetical protein